MTSEMPEVIYVAEESPNNHGGHGFWHGTPPTDKSVERVKYTRAALTAKPADAERGCPICGGEADNGFDRCVPPNPYNCSKCQQDDEIELEITGDVKLVHKGEVIESVTNIHSGGRGVMGDEIDKDEAIRDLAEALRYFLPETEPTLGVREGLARTALTKHAKAIKEAGA